MANISFSKTLTFAFNVPETVCACVLHLGRIALVLFVTGFK